MRASPLLLSLTLTEVAGTGRVKGGGGEVVDYIYSEVWVNVFGLLVLAKENEHITTDTSLLTLYLFLLFWESIGGERGVCDVGVYGGVSVKVCVL